MRYIGSKTSTADRVYRLVAERIPSGTLGDPFGGIGVMGSYFKERGYNVVSGDILTHAHYFQVAKIQRQRSASFARVCNQLGLGSAADVVSMLNEAKERSGWFVREYSLRRKFFTPMNAERIAGCRLLILKWVKEGLLTFGEKAVLLASLINSMDRVANTAGTYYAHLKRWYRKAKKPFQFQLISPTRGPGDCRAYLSDAKDLVALHDFDILYLDPPYNQRCYAGYYHLPETIALGQAPRVHGKAGIPRRQRPKSAFNSPSQGLSALEELLDRASFKLAVLHYSDDGLLPRDKIRKLLRRYGTVEEMTVGANGYTTDHKARSIQQRLYLVTHA